MPNHFYFECLNHFDKQRITNITVQTLEGVIGVIDVSVSRRKTLASE